MSDELQNTHHNHINLENVNEQTECHHHNHNHIDAEDDLEKNKEDNNITTFALGDEKHTFDEEDEVKYYGIILDNRVYWRKNKSVGKFRKMQKFKGIYLKFFTKFV